MPDRYKNHKTKEWKAIRIAVLVRDKYQCRRCGRVDPRAQVDHIVPRRITGSDDPAGLETLCLRCHNTKTANGG